LPQVGRGSIVDETARLVDTVVWDDARIGAGATLERCIVADGVEILSGASLRNCAIIQRNGELAVTDIN
jgi:mannose-1-phosphate guanylyltransferase